MKKFFNCFLICLLFALLSVCVLTACSSSFGEVVVNGIFYKKVRARKDGETEYTECYYVSGCRANVTVLNIASKVNGLPVLGFVPLAFKNNTKLKEIIIPDTILSIAVNDVPFLGCNNIEKVTMPSDQIEDLFVMYGSGNLNVTDPLPESLKVIYLSKACTQIRTSKFRDCKYLEEIHIPSSVAKITDGTNYTTIGVNGHQPDASRFKNLPFLNCNNLTIYCEALSKPDNWGAYWNYTSAESFANVVWGSY